MKQVMIFVFAGAVTYPKTVSFFFPRHPICQAIKDPKVEQGKMRPSPVQAIWLQKGKDK
jgi:hypothetical protein